MVPEPGSHVLQLPQHPVSCVTPGSFPHTRPGKLFCPSHLRLPLPLPLSMPHHSGWVGQKLQPHGFCPACGALAPVLKHLPSTLPAEAVHRTR